MKLTYTNAFANHWAAQRMVRRTNSFRRYDQVIWSVIAALSLLLSAAFASNPKSALYQISQNVFIISLIFAIGLPILRANAAYHVYRANRRIGGKSAKTTTEITQEWLRDSTPGICELNYEWQSVIGFGQNAKITVLCMKGEHFLYFPTSALEATQRAELDELVSRYDIRRWS